MDATKEESKPLAPDIVRTSSRKDRIATLKVMCTSGAGLVADGYDLSVINLALAIMSHLYPNLVTPASKGFIVSLTLIGVIIGQLSFGAIADCMGRRWASLTTAALTILGAVLSACVTDTYGSPWSLPLQLALCRLVLGLGIGGEYPLSAVLSKEVAGDAELTLTRAQLLVINMAALNVGVLIQTLLVLILLQARVNLEVTWRVSFAAGLVPSALAFALRWYMHEPTKSSPKEDDQEAGLRQPSGYWQNIWHVLAHQPFVLFSTCSCWFLFNVVSYAMGSFNAIVCDQILSSSEGESTYSMVRRDAIFALITALCAIAGSTTGFFLESHISRRVLQISAFVGLSILAWLIGGLMGHMARSWNWLLVVFFMGTNVFTSLIAISTYLIPTEYFAAAIRGTCVGLSAASGKAGAAVGTAIFPSVTSRYGLNTVMLVVGFIASAAVVITMQFSPRPAEYSESVQREEKSACQPCHKTRKTI